MKKVIGQAAGILFAVFSIAILGLLMSMTFGALGKLFPDNFTNQIWGLVLFDIAAMIWALAFVFNSESTGQYALSAIGFIAAFVGTLGMVAVEALMSGQTFVEVSPWVGQWLVYGFVLMTALHSALLYAHHAAAPNIHEKINVGIARGEIVTEAIKQATQSLDVQKAALAVSIHHDIVNQVKRDLGMSRGQVIDLPALPVSYNTPTITPTTQAKKAPGLPLMQLWQSLFKNPKGNQVYEMVTPPANLANHNAPIDTPAPITPPLVNDIPAPINTPAEELTYHPMNKLQREETKPIFRGEPIRIISKYDGYLQERAIWKGREMIAIQDEDGNYLLSDPESDNAFAVVTADELNMLRTGAEAPGLGDDFRK